MRPTLNVIERFGLRITRRCQSKKNELNQTGSITNCSTATGSMMMFIAVALKTMTAMRSITFSLFNPFLLQLKRPENEITR
jgi:hypothetical protein